MHQKTAVFQIAYIRMIKKFEIIRRDNDLLVRGDVNDCPLASSLWRPHLAVIGHPHAEKWIDHNFVSADEVIEFLCKQKQKFKLGTGHFW